MAGTLFETDGNKGQKLSISTNLGTCYEPSKPLVYLWISNKS